MESPKIKSGLSLTRNEGQMLYIDFEDKRVEIKINTVQGKQVKMKIIAPKEIIIMRSELLND